MLYADTPFFSISKHSPFFIIYSIIFIICVYIIRAIYTATFLTILKNQNEKHYYETRIENKIIN
jgi:hypothetical protein